MAATLGIIDSFVEKSFQKTWLPPGLDVWVTEWSVSGAGGSADNWLGGLVTVALVDAFLNREVTLTCHHTMRSAFGTGGGRRPTEAEGAEINSVGLALRAIARATTGMASATRLEFPGSPEVQLKPGETYRGLLGWNFRNAAGETRSLIVNLADEEALVASAGLGDAATSVWQLHARPGDPPDRISERQFTMGQVVRLAPYSVTVLSEVQR